MRIFRYEVCPGRKRDASPDKGRKARMPSDLRAGPTSKRLL
jgi:hypothetical protein